MTRHTISIAVAADMSPRIENWLIGRDIEYEVEVTKTKPSRLKIIAHFQTDEPGRHQAEMYRRFLERTKNKEG